MLQQRHGCFGLVFFVRKALYDTHKTRRRAMINARHLSDFLFFIFSFLQLVSVCTRTIYFLRVGRGLMAIIKTRRGHIILDGP